MRNLTIMAAHQTVDPEIWDKLTHQAKRRDLHLATIVASKTVATLAHSKNSKINPNLEKLLTFSNGDIALLSYSNQSLSQHRRNLIRSFLNKE